METTVQGALVDLFLADAALSALVTGSIWTEEIPPEEPTLPWVQLKADSLKPQWIDPWTKIERHAVKATVYAERTQTPGTPNVAATIADGLERIWNWDDLDLANTVPHKFEETGRETSQAKKPSRNGQPVDVVVLTWDVRFESNNPLGG